MDITEIRKHIEQIASRVHDAWWEKKRTQGFHPPNECQTQSAKNTADIRSHGFGFSKFHKFCDKCHTDMYPYDELFENIKDYDRVTVIAVINAIEKI